MNGSQRHARKPDVIGQTTGLINFLREVVQSSHQRLRDDRAREHLWLGSLPEAVRRPAFRQDGVLLVLDHVPRTTPPSLPDVLEGWIDPEQCQDADAEDPPLSDEGPVYEQAHDANGRERWEEHILRREEAAEVLRAYGPWLSRWRSWAEHERADRPVRKLYEDFYHWHQQLAQQDDQYELVLAVGLLTWSDPAGEIIHRHLLTHRVETSVDRRTARLSVRLASEGAIRLEDQDFLDSDDGWAQERAAALGEEIAAGALHPLSTESLEQLAQWQERVLSRPVAFSAEWQPPSEPEAHACLTYAPAIVLRPRDRNALLRLYEQIAASVAAESVAPLGLAQLVLTLNDEERANWEDQGIAPLFGDDPLFPLKTNAQQRSVLGRLERDTGVVVQGPPGTGKTHTIANLVSALLAEGQRVLVTSARDQALTVLREKLPSTVRDLCVLLLSSTRKDGVNELERTINALMDQVAASDTEQLRDDIRRLSDQRDGVRGRISMLTEQLIALREAEIYRHGEVARGYSGRLAEIVQQVQDRADQFDWIGRLPDGADISPPLSPVQAEELLILLRNGEGEPQTGGVFPSPAQLPSLEQVAEALDVSRLSHEGLSSDAIRIRDILAQLDVSVTDELASFLDSCRTAVHHLGIPAAPTEWVSESWVTRALEDRLSRTNLLLWERVISVKDDLGVVTSALDDIGLRLVTIPEDVSIDKAVEMLTTGTELRDYLALGGKLRSRLVPKVQRSAQDILELCTVDGHSPQTAEDLNAILAKLKTYSAINMIAARWDQVYAPIPAGATEMRLATLMERAGKLDHIEAFGAFRERVDELLVRHGVRINITSRQSWNDLTDAMNALANRRAADEATARLANWDDELRAPVDGVHPVAEAIAAAQAIRDQDIERYAKELNALAAARERASRSRRCTELMNRLHDAHPMLAGRLVEELNNPAWDTRLGSLDGAWAWAKASHFVRQQRTPGLERRLEADLAEQEARLEDLTGVLAATRARLHCLERMTQEQRSALQAYRSHMAAYGKGKGRLASKFKAAARDAMTVAQEAVPAWVMPISQVAETVQAKRDAFDVVIIDEASQAGMDALFLMWLAPRVIVVGDDKQCTPSITGMGRLQALQDRLTAHLPDMPSRLRQLYTPHTNLYELLSTFFPEIIRLEEHFRCVPEIINWSSETFYDGALVPLRQYGGERLDPLQTHFIEEAVVKGRDSRIYNPKEAAAIIEFLAKLVENPAYQDKTIGVITLQGSGQVRLLEKLLEQRLTAPVRERHQIRVGNPASFQGDERHIILLSMVVTDPPRIQGGMRHECQAYNVAASRAQDQMHLFYSVPLDRLKTNDLRLNLLTYMQNPPAALEAAADIGTVLPDVRNPHFDSLFEQQVYLRLKERGYHVIPQYPAGNKRIDLVVVGARGRVAVECDGDYYHSTPEQIRHDQQRERELQRVGWRFWRIRESEFRLDPDDTLALLWKELDQQGIRPADYSRSEATVSCSDAMTPWTPLALSSEDSLPDESIDDSDQLADYQTEGTA